MQLLFVINHKNIDLLKQRVAGGVQIKKARDQPGNQAAPEGLMRRKGEV
jgi:hypothetical protein